MRLITLALCLMLTACKSTTPHLATNVQTVEMPVMPSPPAALLIAPERPAKLQTGNKAALLNHSVAIGVYIGELENQNAAWRAWATGEK